MPLPERERRSSLCVPVELLQGQGLWHICPTQAGVLAVAEVARFMKELGRDL